MKPTIISWNGPTEGYSAFAIVNRHLIAALRERGHIVVEGLHVYDGNLTPVFISSTYPPAPPSIRHAINVCVSTWEWHGPRNTPESFEDAFKGYDGVHAMCQQAADAFIESGVPNVYTGSLGVDADEFTPDGERPSLHFIYGGDHFSHYILWVGGTDDRHGLDVAVKVIDDLPTNYTLVVKLAKYYPFEGLAHPRIKIVREDLKSLAPLYRGCDAFLLTARAVAPSMPVLEALACGLPVIAPELPALEELKNWYLGDYIHQTPVWSELAHHHIHKDCEVYWHQTDSNLLAQQVVRAVDKGKPPADLVKLFAAVWSWDDAARELEETIENIRLNADA